MLKHEWKACGGMDRCVHCRRLKARDFPSDYYTAECVLKPNRNWPTQDSLRRCVPAGWRTAYGPIDQRPGGLMPVYPPQTWLEWLLEKFGLY